MSALRLRRARNGEDADVDMTPMLDIVFIMLIFFIVTATFLDETGLDFTQPPDESPTTKIETQSIAIYVDRNNQVSLDRRVTTLENVAVGVERLLADKPDAHIILTADATASLNTVTRIKDAMDGMGRATVIKVNKPTG